jgi:KUP system potassium uptake protein
VFWTLVVVVSIKYVVFIMRADNRGEGGIMALMALTLRKAGGKHGQLAVMLAGIVCRRRAAGRHADPRL